MRDENKHSEIDHWPKTTWKAAEPSLLWEWGWRRPNFAGSCQSSKLHPKFPSSQVILVSGQSLSYPHSGQHLANNFCHAHLQEPFRPFSRPFWLCVLPTGGWVPCSPQNLSVVHTLTLPPPTSSCFSPFLPSRLIPRSQHLICAPSLL